MIKINYAGFFYILTLFSLITTSCSWFKGEDDRLVARAFDQYLYEKDIQGIVPKNVHGNDSVSIINSYIEQWQQQIVLQKKAEKNVNLDDKYIQERLDEYKKSLIRFQYEQELVRQKLDTIVNDTTIENYYKDNRHNFLLKKPILKISYIKLPEGSPKIEMVKKLFLSKDVRDRDLLEKYCYKYSPSFSLADTSWHYVDDLAKFLPISKIGEHNFESFNRIFQISENNALYLLILRNSKFRDSLSPLAFEKENIKNMILNQRKLKLISQMEKEVFLEAQRNNELEVYKKE